MKPIYCCLLLSILFINFSKASTKQDPIPAHDTFKIESEQLGETRTINVWTPSDYKAGKDPLPVMYMADGGLKEDFPHIANTMDELIKAKKIKPMILVGIENTQRRRDLTGPTLVEKDKEIAPVVGGSEKFRAFINDELFAEINKRYRTSGKKGILGESLSGLFVVETFFLKPEMFDYYIAFDPSLWWNDHYFVKTAKEHLAKLPAAKKKLWLASSNTQEIAPYVKELANVLKGENPSNLKWSYTHQPKEDHSTIFRATKEKALTWALGKK